MPTLLVRTVNPDTAAGGRRVLLAGASQAARAGCPHQPCSGSNQPRPAGGARRADGPANTLRVRLGLLFCLLVHSSKCSSVDPIAAESMCGYPVFLVLLPSALLMFSVQVPTRNSLAVCGTCERGCLHIH